MPSRLAVAAGLCFACLLGLTIGLGVGIRMGRERWQVREANDLQVVGNDLEIILVSGPLVYLLPGGYDVMTKEFGLAHHHIEQRPVYQ